ncbi:MAG: hypothetical protein QOE28_560, partial [Solirubrobacteraceae bacterium]|nr:hypothetical protein [Solirubrobacteraceae bacterium]
MSEGHGRLRGGPVRLLAAGTAAALALGVGACGSSSNNSSSSGSSGSSGSSKQVTVGLITK